jgi:hypothetical protein
VMSGPPGGFVEPSRARKAIRAVLPESFRQNLWVRLSMTPVLAEAWAFLDPDARPRRMTRSTELLIEAFPRSGNTYAEAAFRFANGDDVRLSHHLHTVRSVQLAVKYGTPALLLIREPRGILGSYLQFNPRYDGTEILEGYVVYHEALLPQIEHVVVSDFPETTGDFGAVTRRVNARFGTSFQPYERTPENEVAVRGMIENAGASHSATTFERAVSRPSASRRSADEVIAELGAPVLSLLDRAQETYQKMLEAAHRGA